MTITLYYDTTPSNTYDYSKEETNIKHRRRTTAIRDKLIENKVMARSQADK